MTKSRKILVSITLILLLCIIGYIIFYLIDKRALENDINKYEFLNYETNMYTNLPSGNVGDFVYFNDFVTSYYGEYDVLKDKQIPITVNGDIIDLNFYNGETYCLYANTKGKLSIVKWDINTGNHETIYTPPNDVEGLYNFAMTTDGLMFFLERKPSSEVAIGASIEDEGGYTINYTLYIYNPETKEKTALADGVDRYYARGNRLYFNKVHFLKQTEEVFYIDFDKPEEVIDTGICCRNAEAVEKGYSGWFYVDDKYIYYSGGTENYYRCSIKDNEEELLYTYSDSNGYICWSTEFNGKQIIYVRCAFDDPSITFGAKLFELDTETKEVKNVWTDNSKELLVDYNTFKGNDDYFYLTSCYTEGTNCTTYYIITSDYTKKVMFKNSNWKI